PFFDKCFRDNKNNIVLVQIPNLPLALGILFITLDLLFLNSVDSFTFYNLGKSFLFVWAYLEAAQGVNYFRKFMGIIILAILILSYV
ncbi:hypothetical protein KC678_05440, partial [Candidatus Dojkabacteria bacterium]|nr:hypothetical protein [Candidatus Dojkabacteria bacterium]